MGQHEANTTQQATTAGGAAARTDFASQFTASFRVLWLIAAGVTSDASRADDVVQDAALIAMEKYDQFSPGSSFTAWMGQMVRFVALNEMRKNRKRRTTSVDPATMDESAAGANPSDGEFRLTPRGQIPAGQNAFDDRVLRSLEAIGEVARACLLLRTVEGLEYSEIAKVLEIPEGTAMSHVHRARQFLRERLADLAPTAASRRGEPA